MSGKSRPATGETAPVALIADDDLATRLLLRETLEQDGLRVVEAANGREAVERFAETAPGIVLLDVVMPEMDGYAACAALRARPGGASVPILMLTGLEDMDSIQRAYESGATDFATKPINWMILRQRVRYMLRTGQMFEDLRRSRSRLAAAQTSAGLGNWEWELDSERGFWSDEVYRLLGYQPGEFRPDYRKFSARVHADDRAMIDAAVHAARTAAVPYSLDHRIVLADGTLRYLHVQGRVERDPGGRPAMMVGTIQDITDRKQAEERIRTLAYYDSLTNLPNRTLFNEHLQYALSNARRQDRLVAILFIDLDRFKRVNDSLGHGTGDRLLEAVAARFQQCVRDSDVLARAGEAGAANTLARLGGDEFILSLTDIARAEDVARTAQRILAALEAPFQVDAQEIFLSASIGISLYPHDGGNFEALLKNADAAMYHAKEAGRNAYQFFDSSMNEKAMRRLSLENSLRKALDRGEFELHYQPQVDISSRAIVGAEALIRWRHPDIGVVSPAEFIPLAEETGLIVPIGEWVLHSACAQIRRWHEAGVAVSRVAVNLSARQFQSEKLIATVERALRGARLEPRFLEAEITESAVMRDAERSVGILHALKEMGLHIAVDDFGTGYSSLSYLKRFPIDVLKIDRSFINDIATDPDDAAITVAILAMARSLELATVAEGVETQEQLAFLDRHQCRFVQGYLFSRPLPAAEFPVLLRQWPATPAAGRMAM